MVHENETGVEQEVYKGTLGALLYQGETTEIGYQRGGVFRHDPGSVMLSPPEFHYRGSTLTLPVIQIEEFTLTLIDDQGDNADFSNLDWSIYAESGGQEFEIRVVSGDGPGDGQSSHTTIYYSPDGSQYQTWMTKAFVFEEETDTDFNGDGDYDDSRLVLNFTSTDTATYEERNVKSFSNSGFDAKDFTSDPAFEGHENVGEPRNCAGGYEESIEVVVNHSLALMGPKIDLEVADSSQNTVSEEISTGYLQYNETEGYYLTYMHVSENPINVTVN